MMMEAYVDIRCADDDCPLNRRYEGFISTKSKNVPFKATSIQDIVAQLTAAKLVPIFRPLIPNDRAIVEVKQLGLRVEMR